MKKYLTKENVKNLKILKKEKKTDFEIFVIKKKKEKKVIKKNLMSLENFDKENNKEKIFKEKKKIEKICLFEKSGISKKNNLFEIEEKKILEKKKKILEKKKEMKKKLKKENKRMMPHFVINDSKDFTNIKINIKEIEKNYFVMKNNSEELKIKILFEDIKKID